MEHFRMEYGGKEFETSPDNTELIRYVGKLAIYNHVILQVEDIELRVFCKSSAYDYLEELAIANEYPIHDNLQVVLPHEEQAFNEYVETVIKNIPDEVPEEWLYED